MATQSTGDDVEDHYKRMEEADQIHTENLSTSPLTHGESNDGDIQFFDAVQTLSSTSVIVPEVVDSSQGVLVILCTCTRLLAAIALMTAAINIHDNQPGVHYCVAGLMLIASLFSEFLTEEIDKRTLRLGMIGSFMVFIGGIMAFNRRAINIAVIGIIWIIAAIFLTFSHVHDTIQTYKMVNPILASSKIAAIAGSICFLVGGIMMFVMDELAPEEALYQVYNIFAIGGAAYLIHAVNMFTGHRAIVSKVFSKEQRVVSLNSDSDLGIV